MAFDEYKYRILVGLFDMAGQLVSSQITKPDDEERERVQHDYYKEAKTVIREDDKKRLKEEKTVKTEIVEPSKPAEPVMDLTPEKIHEGVACLPCTNDHIATASASLKEAVRFARRPEKGIRCHEVMERIGIALEELNIMERIDLSPESISQLDGEEKKLARWAANKSADLRHGISGIKTPDDLEKMATEASHIKTEFLKEVWDLSTVDGSIEKLCKDLDDDEYKKCVETINKVLSDKKEER